MEYLARRYGQLEKGMTTDILDCQHFVRHFF